MDFQLMHNLLINFKVDGIHVDADDAYDDDEDGPDDNVDGHGSDEDGDLLTGCQGIQGIPGQHR